MKKKQQQQSCRCKEGIHGWCRVTAVSAKAEYVELELLNYYYSNERPLSLNSV